MDQVLIYAFNVAYLLIPMVAANQAGMVGRLLELPGAFTPVSRRLLGENKTLAPYYIGPTIGALMMGLPGQPLWWWGLGSFIGLGVILGDHVKSFLKRRLGREPGSPWWLDRIDFAIGGSVAVKLYLPGISIIFLIGVVALAWPVHYFGNKLSHLLGLRKTPW